MILDKVNYPQDLKNLNLEEKNKLAQEIRELIINTVSNTGGHLASNLGVVELTIALHTIFDTPKDKLIWDVGHQSYVHKILTGRKNKFGTLRKMDGISGFPRVFESEYDVCNSGHSSTSISLATGIARARDLKKETNKVVAIIGDGALTGGMALEAINDVSSNNTDMIVVLNDNEMSISKNVGGISLVLSKFRTKDLYMNINLLGKKTIKKIPGIGEDVVHFVQKAKKGIKQFVIPKMYFENAGFKYLGPVDGHDILELEKILKIARRLHGAVLVHVITQKGKGYEPAEKNPDKFHGISKFNVETGEKISSIKTNYSAILGNKLVELAENNEKIVAITAAMKDGTGLKKFGEIYPNRFFDVGIAEQHALCMAAGLAINGMIPIVPLYSSFLQRGLDQLIHDIAIPNLPVVICVDRAGVVGNDGETHQGLFDMTFLKMIPNFTIMSPKDFNEFEKMIEFAVNLNKPVAIRYPRGGEEKKFKKCDDIQYGKHEIIRKGKNIVIFSIGKMVARAQKIAENLLYENIDASVVNMRFLKPVDENEILNQMENKKMIITIEDGTEIGGLADTISDIMVRNNINAKFLRYAYPDEFIKHGDTKKIEEKYGISESEIGRDILKNFIEL